MAKFDVHNLDINSKLPEWWKNDSLLAPINLYTQELILNMVSAMLDNIGVAQPINVWKWLPIEYNWMHNYFSSDEYLQGRDMKITPEYPITALMPNTKRPCDAYIHLVLKGNQRDNQENTNLRGQNRNVTLKLKNGFQTLTFKNISNLSDIEIFTETGDILIDGAMDSSLFEGSFKKIQSVAKYPNYERTYIDENGQTQTEHIDITDENKITKLEIECDDEVEFDLYIELVKPVFVTEQHIRLATVSAFPLEWVRLYGFFCHDFNDKEGYKLLWEKRYNIEDRVVYDKITKQFDCERFYVQVKLHGIGTYLSYGFPQEILPSNPMYKLNNRLDKWGEIYGLPRRYYRTDISIDEEINTYPQFYNYDVEQDFWYEERMTNEYRYNHDATDALFLKDTDLNNVILLESISPNINDAWIFTQTIVPEGKITRETPDIYPCKVTPLDDYGIKWPHPQAITKDTLISEPMELHAYIGDDAEDDANAKTEALRLRFNLSDLNIPKNIDITGIELKIKAETNIYSDVLRLDANRSKMLLNHVYKKDNGDIYSQEEEIDIATELKAWKKGVPVHTVGGKNYLFNQDSIHREQLFTEYKDSNGEFKEKGYLDFIIAFENVSKEFDVRLLVHTISLKIYYNLKKDDFNISMSLSDKQIILSKNQESVNLTIDVKNVGDTKIDKKRIFIEVPPELTILNNKNQFDFDLDIGESFTIGDGMTPYNGVDIEDESDIITIKTVDKRVGKYDVIVFCDDKVIKDEIIVKEGFEKWQ